MPNTYSSSFEIAELCSPTDTGRTSENVQKIKFILSNLSFPKFFFLKDQQLSAFTTANKQRICSVLNSRAPAAKS